MDDTEKYLADIKQFFEKKRQWETSKTKKCLLCNSSAKMVFEITDNEYLAKCGNKAECQLSIPRRKYILLSDKIAELRTKIDNFKQRFIRQKMDTAYKFISATPSVKIFKDEFEDYRETVKQLEDYEKQASTEEQMREIRELNVKLDKFKLDMQRFEALYKTEHKQQNVDDSVTIYFDKIAPLVKEIRQKQWPIIETVVDLNHIKLNQLNTVPKFIRTI